MCRLHVSISPFVIVLASSINCIAAVLAAAGARCRYLDLLCASSVHPLHLQAADWQDQARCVCHQPHQGEGQACCAVPHQVCSTDTRQAAHLAISKRRLLQKDTSSCLLDALLCNQLLSLALQTSLAGAVTDMIMLMEASDMV